MTVRFDPSSLSPQAYRSMLALEGYLATCGLEHRLVLLLKLRVSQMNGCAYCIDMHWKDLRADGESEQRLYGLDAWRESPYYSDRERAALEWAESITRITSGHVPDAVYESTRAHFSEKEVSDLMFVVTTINAWTRLAISARTVPGRYQPVQRPARTTDG